jgi:2-polyprenyl-6-methoxyphenol hydroxylase-like FAD-dependent oxidoreductase
MSVKSEPVCIIGAGPAGLSTAIALARLGYKNVKVFDKLDEPLAPDSPDWVDLVSPTFLRSYNIGISGRGQKVLRALGVMDKIENFAADVTGRKDWSPESPIDSPREVIYTGVKSYTTRVIQRDRLASVLLRELRTNDAFNKVVTIHYGSSVSRVDFPTSASKTRSSALLHITSKSSVGELVLETPLVIGADGTASALRDAMETSSRGKVWVRRFEDKNVRVYRTIPLHFPPNNDKWKGFLNYSVRTKNDINIDALPTKGGPMLGVVLYRPWDERITGLKTLADAKKFFRDVLPQFTEVLKDEDLERFAKKEDSKLPRFSFAGGRLEHAGVACLVGDACHTVKPYFGLGVNSAFEDVLALSESLEKNENDVPKALAEYSSRRAPEARAMVEMSKRLDGGFLTFVLPLIVDTICHKKAPWIFSPSTLSSLQNEKLTFSYIQWRKRLDRVLQSSVLAGVGWVLARAVSFLARGALRAVVPAAP